MRAVPNQWLHLTGGLEGSTISTAHRPACRWAWPFGGGRQG